MLGRTLLEPQATSTTVQLRACTIIKDLFLFSCYSYYGIHCRTQLTRPIYFNACVGQTKDWELPGDLETWRPGIAPGVVTRTYFSVFKWGGSASGIPYYVHAWGRELSEFLSQYIVCHQILLEEDTSRSKYFDQLCRQKVASHQDKKRCKLVSHSRLKSTNYNTKEGLLV